MRKYLTWAILLIATMTFAYIYLILPGSISIQRSIVIEANKDALFRTISSTGWKGNSLMEMDKDSYPDQKVLFLNKRYYKIDYHTSSSFKINITGKDSINSILTLITKHPDSTLLVWQSDIPSSYNPLTRILNFFGGSSLGNDMQNILKKLSSSYSGNAIYGIDVKREEVNDSILIYNSTLVKDYPSTSFIYNIIDRLKSYALTHSAKTVGYPMLNITNYLDKLFKIRIALPVNKVLPSSKNIEYRRMMGKAKMLVVTVKGDNSEINSAYKKFELYIRDYRFESAAIDFQSLVTDRLLEKDSSKWITKICYPVR